MQALSHGTWIKAIGKYAETPREKELAEMLVDVLQRSAETPAVVEYLTERARKSLE